MQLNVSFEALHTAVRRMGAPLIDDFTAVVRPDLVDPIDRDLERGIEAKLSEVGRENGLLSHKKRQVLLYIQDQGGKIGEVLEDGSIGRKYHVADCVTLEEMRRKNRFERYVITSNLSPDFFISGMDWESGQEMEGHSQLKVCKNCLKKLNYRGYDAGGLKKEIFSMFNLEEFFSTYSSFFPHLPARFAGPSAQDKYTDDWKRIAREYKKSRNFICEGELKNTKCRLDLSEHKRLLHVHHVDGVKKNNHLSNLKALCVECHSKQPCHEHMFVSHRDRQTITRLRRKQGRLEANGWGGVIEVADPGIEGLAIMCRQMNLPVPEVGYEIPNSNNNLIVELELAWPGPQIGVAINIAIAGVAKAKGWEIWKMVDALDKFEIFREHLLERVQTRV